MTDDNTNWRTSNFRQNVVQKINEVILSNSTETSCSRNGIEMEAHAFQKAKNKDEYLAFVARFILHVREMNSKNKNPQNIGDVNNTGGPGMPDPINALQNMASPGTRNPQMMGMPGAGPTGGGNMGVGGNIPTDDNTNWRTPNFRQNVVQKINEAILSNSTETSCSRNGIEMEAHSFQKAKSKDEYLAFVARFILHICEMNLKNELSRNIDGVNNTESPEMSHLINALQNISSLGTGDPQMVDMPETGPTGNGNIGHGDTIPALNLLQTPTQQSPGQQNPQ